MLPLVGLFAQIDRRFRLKRMDFPENGVPWAGEVPRASRLMELEMFQVWSSMVEGIKHGAPSA